MPKNWQINRSILIFKGIPNLFLPRVLLLYLFLLNGEMVRINPATQRWKATEWISSWPEWKKGRMQLTCSMHLLIMAGQPENNVDHSEVRSQQRKSLWSWRPPSRCYPLESWINFGCSSFTYCCCSCPSILTGPCLIDFNGKILMWVRFDSLCKRNVHPRQILIRVPFATHERRRTLLPSSPPSPLSSIHRLPTSLSPLIIGS